MLSVLETRMELINHFQLWFVQLFSTIMNDWIPNRTKYSVNIVLGGF